MRTRNSILQMACAAALLQGTSSFAGLNGSVGKPQHREVSASKPAAPLAMNSNLFSYVPNGQSNYDDSLVNNRYSASDWLHNVFTLPQSSVLRDIQNPVLTICLWSTVVSIIQRMLSCSTNKAMTRFASDMCIGAAPHSFLVSSLGLLLVFRTNSAYQRFHEGRVIWENILSISRNISRMTRLYNKEVGKDRQHRIANLVAAFPYLLRHHVRPGCLCEAQDKEGIPARDRLLLPETRPPPLDTRFEGDRDSKRDKSSRECYVNRTSFPWSLFEKRSLKKVARAKNRPLWVCDRVGREVMSIPYGPNFTSRERLSILGQVEKLTNTIGQCERIHQTAVPLNYARHSLRALTLWLVTLPFCLVKDMGLLTGPAMAAISWLLFGVYQIGYSIEDPFRGSLRLSILCDAIRKDVLHETRGRDSAFDLDWDDEDDEEDDWDQDETIKELEHVKETVKPYIPKQKQANLSNWILETPSLVKESGNWNVVGVREG